MANLRYSRWDGTQPVFDFDEGAVVGELSDHLLSSGDLNSAIHNIQRRGLPGQFGERGPGIQQLLQDLLNVRQQTLSQYDLSSLVTGIKERLEQIVELERDGISRQVDAARSRMDQAPPEGAAELDPATMERLFADLKRRASRNLSLLDGVRPDDPAEALRQFRDYEFMDVAARNEFDELLRSLQRQVADSFVKDVSESLEGMSPQGLHAMEEMVRDLNRLLEQRIRDEEPDFQAFMDRHGAMFGPDAPHDMDELADLLEHRMAQARSLLASLSSEQSAQLEELMRAAFDTPGLRGEITRLMENLDYLSPLASLGKDYAFIGDDALDLSSALDQLDQLHRMDTLERQLRRTEQGAEADEVDPALVRTVLGEDAGRALLQLAGLTDYLEQAGHIKRDGQRFELTPKGTRKIGQRALQEIFADIKLDRAGGHHVDATGAGIEQADDTKMYEFGDTFAPHLQKTIMNAVMREHAGTPVRMQPEDFEVYRTENLAQSSTVLMLDLSLSMAMRGNFTAAKKVALALDSLIRHRFPHDRLQIIGFSTYAREVKTDRLPYLSWDEFDPYTNIQHGLALAQKLLSRFTGGTKQIVMISDGEPTAHMEGGETFLQYPPSPRTIRATLGEVKRCTQQNIVINTFMLDSNSHLVGFIDQMTRINRGRVFYTTPEQLGQYILVDYLDHRHRKMVT
jgi:uncharacterized protein with von Willebrand factor type A (vWA) domain